MGSEGSSLDTWFGNEPLVAAGPPIHDKTPVGSSPVVVRADLLQQLPHVGAALVLVATAWLLRTRPRTRFLRAYLLVVAANFAVDFLAVWALPRDLEAFVLLRQTSFVFLSIDPALLLFASAEIAGRPLRRVVVAAIAVVSGAALAASLSGPSVFGNAPITLAWSAFILWLALAYGAALAIVTRAFVRAPVEEVARLRVALVASAVLVVPRLAWLPRDFQWGDGPVVDGLVLGHALHLVLLLVGAGVLAAAVARRRGPGPRPRKALREFIALVLVLAFFDAVLLAVPSGAHPNLASAAAGGMVAAMSGGLTGRWLVIGFLLSRPVSVRLGARTVAIGACLFAIGAVASAALSLDADPDALGGSAWLLFAGGGAALATWGWASHVGREPASPDANASAGVGGVLASRYRLDRVLGAGSTGRTYRASDLLTGEPVAVKVVPRLGGSSAEAQVLRAVRAAQGGRRGGSARVIGIFDVIEAGGSLVVVMELAERSLARERRPMAPAEAVPVILDVLEGLAWLHRRGLVHLDVKPSNLLVGADGRVRIADFSISARVPEEDPTIGIASEGKHAGTLAYMAPEQARGEAAIGPAADLYAAAALAYEILTGEPPLEVRGLSELDARDRIARSPPRLPRAELPDAMNAWLARGLAKAPSERFANAEEMRRSLQEAAAMLLEANRS